MLVRIQTQQNFTFCLHKYEIFPPLFSSKGLRTCTAMVKVTPKSYSTERRRHGFDALYIVTLCHPSTFQRVDQTHNFALNHSSLGKRDIKQTKIAGTTSGYEGGEGGQAAGWTHCPRLQDQVTQVRWSEETYRTYRVITPRGAKHSRLH